MRVEAQSAAVAAEVVTGEVLSWVVGDTGFVRVWKLGVDYSLSCTVSNLGLLPD